METGLELWCADDVVCEVDGEEERGHRLHSSSAAVELDVPLLCPAATRKSKSGFLALRWTTTAVRSSSVKGLPRGVLACLID